MFISDASHKIGFSEKQFFSDPIMMQDVTSDPRVQVDRDSPLEPARKKKTKQKKASQSSAGKGKSQSVFTEENNKLACLIEKTSPNPKLK